MDLFKTSDRLDTLIVKWKGLASHGIIYKVNSSGTA